MAGGLGRAHRLACAARGPCGGQGRDRRHRRSVGRLCGRERPAGGRGDQDGDRRFRRQRARPADRVPDRGPPEQARHRREQVPRMGRHQGAHHAARRLQHRREPGARADRQGEEDSPVRDRRRRRLADRQGLQRLHGPLRLRYDGARQRHGQDDRGSGRQILVLHHGGLCVRHAASAGGDQGRRRGRRQGRGLRQGAARDL